MDNSALESIHDSAIPLHFLINFIYFTFNQKKSLEKYQNNLLRKTESMW